MTSAPRLSRRAQAQTTAAIRAYKKDGILCVVETTPDGTTRVIPAPLAGYALADPYQAAKSKPVVREIEFGL
jgi:hypothetical protein